MIDIKTRKKKSCSPSPGDVFCDAEGFRYIMALSPSGSRLAVSIDTWVVHDAEDIRPTSEIDAMLILTED